MTRTGDQDAQTSSYRCTYPARQAASSCNNTTQPFYNLEWDQIGYMTSKLHTVVESCDASGSYIRSTFFNGTLQALVRHMERVSCVPKDDDVLTCTLKYCAIPEHVELCVVVH